MTTQNRIMRMLLLVLSIVALAAVVLVLRPGLVKPAQAQENKKTQKWEYCSVSNAYAGPNSNEWLVSVSRGGEREFLETDMSGVSAFNKLGADGWELVGVGDEPTRPGNQITTTFIFKRPR